MKIAFYATMKPPTSPIPSGDRRVARLLIKALRKGGHKVELASKFKSRDSNGEFRRQIQLRDQGYRLADRLIERYRNAPAADRPHLWFTYHTYYKAPDWIGPRVADALDIPYVVAEASYAPRREGGPWDMNLQSVAESISRADIVFNLNSADEMSVLPFLKSPKRLVKLRPFMETPKFKGEKSEVRKALAQLYDLDLSAPWLVTVAMMRDGAKFDSYRALGESLRKLNTNNWRLLVVGDGPARHQVEQSLCAPNVIFTGEKRDLDLLEILAAADVFVWPAVDEAYGMAMLEAQAMGLPVIAGKTGGVGDIVRHKKTGLLVAPDRADLFAQAIDGLLDQPDKIATWSQSARRIAQSEHSLEEASRVLDQAIRKVLR